MHRKQGFLKRIIDLARWQAAPEVAHEPGRDLAEQPAIGAAITALRRRHQSAPHVRLAA